MINIDISMINIGILMINIGIPMINIGIPMINIGIPMISIIKTIFWKLGRKWDFNQFEHGKKMAGGILIVKLYFQTISEHKKNIKTHST